MAKAKQSSGKALSYWASARGWEVRETSSRHLTPITAYAYPGSFGRIHPVVAARIISIRWSAGSIKHEDKQRSNHGSNIAIIQLYALRDQPYVLQFLQEHAYLVPLLLETHPYITKYFPDVQLALEVVRDPEGKAQAALMVAVPTSLEPAEAIARLDRFDEAWWFGVVDRARGRLIISLEYL